MASRSRNLSSIAIVLILLGATTATSETILFLVAEPFLPVHGDSYVLPLSDPQAIAHARDLIQFGPQNAGSPIVVAHVAEGANGINRDLLAPGAPEWSWHVTEFLGFADATIEILDGWPGFVEQDVQGWLENTGGTIGFWDYTVVSEVPEPSSRVLLVSGIAFLLALSKLRRRRLNRRKMVPLSINFEVQHATFR